MFPGNQRTQPWLRMVTCSCCSHMDGMVWCCVWPPLFAIRHCQYPKPALWTPETYLEIWILSHSNPVLNLGGYTWHSNEASTLWGISVNHRFLIKTSGESFTFPSSKDQFVHHFLGTFTKELQESAYHESQVLHCLKDTQLGLAWLHRLICQQALECAPHQLFSQCPPPWFKTMHTSDVHQGALNNTMPHVGEITEVTAHTKLWQIFQ